MAFLTKDQLKQRITELHEIVVSSPWLGGDVLLRELTAAQRMSAADAAQSEVEGDAPNNYLYRAMLLQMMIADPDSGTPYGDRRTHPQTGEPLIDPRTRTPFFTSDEIVELMEGREGPVEELLQRGLGLSRLLPNDFRDRVATPDAPERDTGPRDGTDEADHREDADGAGESPDERTAHSDEAAGAAGEELGLSA